MDVADRPRLTAAEAIEIAGRHYGITGEIEPLASERDRNFRVRTPDDSSFVLKISHPDEAPAVLDFQNAALTRLFDGSAREIFPRVRPAVSEAEVISIEIDGRPHLVRLVTYLEGRPLASIDDPSSALLADLGSCIAVTDNALADFAHPAMHRTIRWDSKHALLTIPPLTTEITRPDGRALVERTIARIHERLVTHLPHLPMGVIHNDVNTHNVLVGDDDRVSGIIDFGDMVHTYRVCDLANALAYVMLDADDPLARAVDVVRGFVERRPLESAELAALRDFVLLRLCLSVSIAADQRRRDPENAYLGITETPAWDLLGRLETLGDEVDRTLARTANARLISSRPAAKLLAARGETLSATLSTSYRTPLKIVKGRGAYLYDEEGRPYLDCVNNVCHVGHCHPRVVAAAREQMARLNTNTRYLHDNIVTYAERLTATLPDSLSVCFFVNSGSEANDLALRLARTHTGAHDVVVIDQAYHGHTASLIDVSPYKHDGPGGRHAPPSTHALPIPDRYRGPYGYDDPEAGKQYAEDAERVFEALRAEHRPLAAFIAESILGVAGQIELPPGYLERIYDLTRRNGGLAIADEVQVGFGRTTGRMWAFCDHDVVPDIVTMGKPIGNGHPLAAVVTSPEVAASFETGMEYFNTFGGNPVSCAVGLAVLDVIETERLDLNALLVGGHLLRSLRRLAEVHPVIGDVRGTGLFLGIELVRDRTTREPAAEEAGEIVERAKDKGVLLSTDGPYRNVIKIKPPLVFSRNDADLLVSTLDVVCSELEREDANGRRRSRREAEGRSDGAT